MTNFNNFFVDVGQNTETAIPKVPNISPTKFKKNLILTTFIIAHISNEEILDIINSLENKSTGPSSIPLKLLLLIPDLIIIPLASIINMSLNAVKNGVSKVNSAFLWKCVYLRLK